MKDDVVIETGRIYKTINMQSISGGGGAIGVELAKALTDCTNQIRLASRNPAKIGKEFNITTASYAEEIRQIIQNDYSK